MLNQEQLAILRTNVLANADTLAAYNAGDLATLAALYNAAAVPAAPVWDRQVVVDPIHDGIDYTKYTPTDAADGTAIYTNRILAIQTKQMNLQNMMVGKVTLDATKATLRNGIKDATTAIPAGTGGANIHPGGASGTTVLTTLLRPTNATRFEKLFSSGTATTGVVVGELLTLEGPIHELQFAEL